MSNKPSDTEMQSVPKASSGQNQQDSKQAQQNAKQVEQAQQNAQQATQAVEKNSQAERKAAEQQVDIGEQEADKFVRGKGNESDDSGTFHRDSGKSSDDDGKFNKKEEKDEDAFEKSKDDKDKKKGEGGEDDDSQPFKKSGDKEKGLGGKLKDAMSKEDDDPVAKASNQNPDAGPNAGKQGGDSKASSDEGEEKDDKNNPAKKMAEKVKKKAKKKATSTATGTLGRMFILGKIAAALKAFLAMFVNALAAVAQALFGWLFNLIMFVKGLVNAVLGFLGGIVSGIGSFFGGIVSGIAGFFGVSTIAAGISFFGTCIALLAGTVAAVVSSNEDNAIKERDMTYASPSCAEQAYNAVFEALEGDDGTFTNQEIDNAKKITSVFWEWSYKAVGEDKATIMISGILGNLYAEGHIDFAGVEGVYNEPNIPGDKKSQIMASRSSLSSYTSGELFTMYRNNGKSINEDFYQAKTSQGGDDNYYCHTGVWSATGINGYHWLEWCDANDQVWYSPDANIAWFIYENENNRGALNFANWCIKGEPDCSIREVNFDDADAYKDAAKIFYSRWENTAGPEVEGNCDASRWEWAEKWVPYVNSWLNGGDVDTAYAQSIIGLANSSADNASNDAVTDMMGDCSGFHAKYNNANLASAALSLSYFDANEEDIMNGNPDYDISSGGIGFTQAEIDDGDSDGDSQAVYDANAEKFKQGCTKTYIDVIEAIEPDCTYKMPYSSCCRGVATPLKWSGAYDCVGTWGGAETVGDTCKNNPEQFDYFEWDGKNESLEPGDIVYDGGHIWMFVGSGVTGGLVEAKYHDRVSADKYYICHASYGGRGIKCGENSYANGTGDHVWYDENGGRHDDHWHVVRCKKYEENPKWVNVLNEQGAQEDVQDQQNGEAETEN